MRLAARMRLRTRTRGHRADAVLAGLALAGVALCVVALSGCMGWHAGAMAGEPKSATYANVAGTRVRYVDTGPGAGPAVVLIHGFASSLEAWDAVIPTLAREHRVLALDLKGFGWTDRAPGDYTPYYEAFGRAVREGGPLPVSGAEAVSVLEVLDAPRESDARHAVIGL